MIAAALIVALIALPLLLALTIAARWLLRPRPSVADELAAALAAAWEGRHE